MIKTVLSALALLTLIFGCSHFQSSNPADCDVQSSPDSKACFAKEVALLAACDKADPLEQRACVADDVFLKERLTNSLIKELDGIPPIGEDRKKDIARKALNEDLEAVAKHMYDNELSSLSDVVEHEWCQQQANRVIQRLSAGCPLKEAIGYTHESATIRFDIVCLEGWTAADDAKSYAFRALLAQVGSLQTEAAAQELYDITRKWYNANDTVLGSLERRYLEFTAFMIFERLQAFKDATAC